MNLSITQNTSYRSPNFGKALYTPKAIDFAKRLVMNTKKAEREITLNKFRGFTEYWNNCKYTGIIKKALLGGLAVTIVDTSAKGTVKNKTFGLNLREDDPFKDARDYCYDLSQTCEYFDNVEIASCDDFIPGPYETKSVNKTQNVAEGNNIPPSFPAKTNSSNKTTRIKGCFEDG